MNVQENITMGTQTRTISTTAHFTVTDAAGQESNAYRELALVEKGAGGWLLVVTEPDQDDPEGDVLSGVTIEVPGEAAGVFDDLFALITDPSSVGVRA